MFDRRGFPQWLFGDVAVAAGEKMKAVDNLGVAESNSMVWAPGTFCYSADKPRHVERGYICGYCGKFGVRDFCQTCGAPIRSFRTRQ